MPAMGKEKQLKDQTRNIQFSKYQFVKNDKHLNPIQASTVESGVQSVNYHFVVTYEKQVVNYTRVRKICLYVYKNDKATSNLLKLHDVIPNNFKDWHKHVFDFYSNLLEKADTSQLAVFEITEDFITSCKDEMIKICSYLHGSN
jgi:hypothetical protein